MDRNYVNALRRLLIYVEEKLCAASAQERLKMMDTFSMAGQAVQEIEEMHVACECCHTGSRAGNSAFCQSCIDRGLRAVLGLAGGANRKDEIPY